MAATEQGSDGKLSAPQARLIRPVERAKERAPRLDEMDDAEAQVDRSFEALFDNPS